MKSYTLRWKQMRSLILVNINWRKFIFYLHSEQITKTYSRFYQPVMLYHSPWSEGEKSDALSHVQGIFGPCCTKSFADPGPHLGLFIKWLYHCALQNHLPEPPQEVSGTLNFEVWFWPLLECSTGYDRNTVGMSKLGSGRGSVTEGVLAKKKRGWVSALIIQHSPLSTVVFSSVQIILLLQSSADLTLNPVKVRSHRRCPWESGTDRVLAGLWLLWLQDIRILHAIWRPGWMLWGISRCYLCLGICFVNFVISSFFPLQAVSKYK